MTSRTNYHLTDDAREADGYIEDAIRDAVRRLIEVERDGVDIGSDARRAGYSDLVTLDIIPGSLSPVLIDWPESESGSIAIPCRMTIAPYWEPMGPDAEVEISNPRRIDAERVAVDVDWA